MRVPTVQLDIVKVKISKFHGEREIHCDSAPVPLDVLDTEFDEYAQPDASDQPVELPVKFPLVNFSPPNPP